MSTKEKSTKSIKKGKNYNNKKQGNNRRQRYYENMNRNGEGKKSVQGKQLDENVVMKSEPKIETGNEALQEAIERNKYTLDLVNMWINNADNKIGMAFAILSAVLALIVFVAEDVLSGLDINTVNSCIMCWFKLLVLVSVLSFGVSIWFYIQCIIPRFTNDKIKNKDYSIFYDEIKNYKDYKEYIEKCSRATNKQFNEEIVKEIYFNSRICSKKMRNFRTGIILSVSSIFAAILAALDYYLAVTIK